MGTKKNDKYQLLTRTCINQTTSWLMHNWSTFGARMNHEQTQIHKIHHMLDLEETITFPLKVFPMLGHGSTPNCHFVLGLPSWNLEIPKVATFGTLGAHNFLCKPPIEMRFEAKLYPSSRAFQWYVACHLHIKKSGRFPTFSGRESNCQFDSQPFFWP
jgi:hypothetical protein